MCEHFVNSALERERIETGGLTNVFQGVIGETFPGAGHDAATTGPGGEPLPPWLVKSSTEGTTSGTKPFNGATPQVRSQSTFRPSEDTRGGGIDMTLRIMMVMLNILHLYRLA